MMSSTLTLNKIITNQTNQSDSKLFKDNKLNIIKEIGLFVAAFIIIFVCYIIFKPMNRVYMTDDGAIARCVGCVLLAITFISYFYLRYKKKMDFKRTIIFILILAFIVHLTYLLYTSGHTRQHDTWSTNNDAHYDYALAIYETWKLPDHHIDENTIYQFYHPPFNAFVQAVFMHIFDALCPVESLKATTEDLYSSCQILACFYMFISSYFICKTILLTSLSDKAKIFACLVGALFPRLAQLSGQLNNDGISIMFSFISLYFFVKWLLKGMTWLDIILTSLFIGLALASKLSSATICLGIGVIFAIIYIKTILSKDKKKIINLTLQFVTFLLICAPLGLWWNVYLHNVYGLPYNYVFDRLNSALFIGSRDWVLTNKPNDIVYYDENNVGIIYNNGFYNFIMRFISPFYYTDFFSIWCNAGDNYNLFTYALKSSIFGEFAYYNGEGFGLISLISIYFVYFMMVIFIIYSIYKKKFHFEDGAFLSIIGGMVILFIYLQISMPFGCSMDFRYIVPIILPCVYFIGRQIDLIDEFMLERKKIHDDNLTSISEGETPIITSDNQLLIKSSRMISFSKIVNFVSLASIFTFVISSYLFYMVAI